MNNIEASSSFTFSESKSQLRYGNISYEILQDIELAVISLKELKYMLSSHYRCYFDERTSIGDQIAEFGDTQYHSNVVDTAVKNRLCAVMKGLLYERSQIVHTEGIDFLRDRNKFINQSMEVFHGLSPTENGIGVSPARHSVLVPCPNSQSLLEDLTFIDYEQYEDISIAVKVTKRIDHILREVFQQPGETLHCKIINFPYDANNIKRKMSQVNTIKNRMIHDRYVNNFDNRVEYINLSQSIFANLIEIVDSGKVYRFGGHNLDMLSNTTDDNNVTISMNDETTVSTYHIPAHAPLTYPYPHSKTLTPPTYPHSQTMSPPTYPHSQTLSPPTYPHSQTLSPQTATRSYATSNNYERLPNLRDDSTIPVDAEAFAMREYNRETNRFLPTHTTHTTQNTRYRLLEPNMRWRIKDERNKRRNKKWINCCKHCFIGGSIVGFFLVIAVVCYKYLF